MPRPVPSAAAPSAVARLPSSRRFIAAALSGAIHLAALAALLLWHFTPSSRDAASTLTVVDLPEDTPPERRPEPPPEPVKHGGEARKDQAAPPAPKAAAAPLAVAVIPVIVPTFAPAPVPSTGDQANTGNALAGTGTGAGGQGSGTGGGGTGEGNGGRRGQREGVPPEITRGDFKPSDYPKSLREAGPRGRTWTEVTVGVNGRPLSCQVTRSSGTALLDSETCRIIMQRFRFRPGKDAAGKPTVAPFNIDIGWEYIDLNDD